MAVAETAFGFLDRSEPSARQRIDEAFKTTLAYPLGEAFVELELDWREQASFVLVGWCRDGEIPDGYYVDGYGTVVRHHLAVVLKGGEPAERAAADRLRKALKYSGPEAMARQIQAYSDVLREIHARLPALLANLPSSQ